MCGYTFKPEHLYLYESAERRERQPPETIVSRVKIEPQDGVADIGAGTGYLALHIAKNHAKARVFAVDSQKEMTEHMQMRAEAYELRNFNIFMTPADKTRLKTGGIHHVFMMNLLHDVDDLEDVLKEFDRILVPGGDVTIIEPKKVEGTMGPPLKERLELEEAVGLMESTGVFKLVNGWDDAEDWYQLMFRRK